MQQAPADPGERAIWWISHLTLSGDYAGEPFVLRPWQQDFIRRLFGTIRPDGRRQYRRAFLFIPRKQGKTQLTAAIALFALMGTGKRGECVLVAAAAREQADVLFTMVAEMIGADRHLSRKVKNINRTKQTIKTTDGNELKVLSGEGNVAHGPNPSVIILDELHALPNRRLYDALTSGRGARREPLLLLLSTAGEDRSGLCREEYDRGKQVRDGLVEDQTYLPVLYCAEPEDDWTDPAVWAKANPALGDYYSAETLAEEVKRAQEMPSEEWKVRTYYLNQWLGSNEKWLKDLVPWAEADAKPVNPVALVGRRCFAGLDLSNVSDITALALIFPPVEEGEPVKIVTKFWAPSDYGVMKDSKGLGSYQAWAARGLIDLCPGTAIDYDVVEKAVTDLSAVFDIQELRIDRHNAPQSAQHLVEAGLNVCYQSQSITSLNAPVKHLEWLLARGEVAFGGNPVLAWMASNAVARTDSNGNRAFEKPREGVKIDGLSAVVNGLAAYLFHEPPPEVELVVIRRTA